MARAASHRPAAGCVMAEPDQITPAVASMTAEQALEITAKVKSYIGCVWRLLCQVHENRGYISLGYQTFEDYLRTELDISRRQGYRLIDQGKVITAITEAAEMSPNGDIEISEADSRAIKPQLELVVSKVRDRVEHGEPAEVVIPDVVKKTKAVNYSLTKKGRDEQRQHNLLAGLGIHAIHDINEVISGEFLAALEPAGPPSTPTTSPPLSPGWRSWLLDSKVGVRPIHLPGPPSSGRFRQAGPGPDRHDHRRPRLHPRGHLHPSRTVATLLGLIGESTVDWDAERDEVRGGDAE